MALEGVLARIPGLAGYLAQQQFNERGTSSDIQQAAGLSAIAGRMQEQELRKAAMQKAEMEEQALKGAVAQSGGDPAKAIQALLQAGTPKSIELATKLKGLVDKGTPIGSGGLRLPDGTVVPPAERPGSGTEPEIVRLQKYAESLLPTDPRRLEIEARIKNLAPEKPEPGPKALPTRKRMAGETEIQEELQPDGTWKEIGKGPRFARSVAPAVGAYAAQGALNLKDHPEELKDLAIQSLYDPGSLAGFRRDTKTMAAIQQMRIKVMREAGVTSEDVVSGRAGFKADTASLNKITPQYDAITAFEKTAIRNGKILMTLADKVDTTGVPVIERWVRAGKKSIVGDPDVAAFHAQMNLYRAEAARILTQPNLSGVLTDTARKEMEEVINNSASAAQVRKVVNLLEQDFNNRKETLEEQIAAIRARMRNRVAPGASPAGEPSPSGGKVVNFGDLK